MSVAMMCSEAGVGPAPGPVPPVFGVIVSGRLPQTDFIQVDSNRMLTVIPEAETINHIVVFMTGLQPLAPTLGASVFYSWPQAGGSSDPSWQYLGFISNNKPSAVFRITKLRPFSSPAAPTLAFGHNQAIVSNGAQIGISVEPLAQIEQQMPSINSTADNLSSFASKTAESLFNYVSSFARVLPPFNEQLVPLNSIQQWYQNYIRKIQVDPNFWRN